MSSPPDGLPPLREVIRAHALDARKSLGQHFLLDLNITAKIVRGAGGVDGAEVLEVGPGPGGLTRAILAGGARRVVAVERDPRCLAALDQIAGAYPGRLDVVQADALDTDATALVGKGASIIANLPYNVGTALLFLWLPHPGHFSSMTLMFQREVADRITARPGDGAYGRLAVMANWRWRAERLFDLPARAFTPPPKVASAVVRLTPRDEPLAEADGAVLSRVVAAAFNQRRKMLRQSLKGLGGDAAALLQAADIDPTRRAETLSIQEFCALARALQGLR
jgi:16S rRNA (adenine1518-N6/adenine1519-N6)-dimethyltransferase